MRVLIAMCAVLAATAATNLSKIIPPAWAADTPTTPTPAANQALAPDPALPYSWSGFYIRGSENLNPSSPAMSTGLSDSLFSASSTGLTNSTGQVGANWQNGKAVVGFESDMQWSDQWASPLTSCGLGCSLNDRVKVPWLATLRARAGTAFDRMYIYGTGGFATSGSAGSLDPTASGSAPNFVNLSAGDLNWTIGGGMEFAIDQNVSAKIEYLHTSPATGAPESLFDAATTGSVKNDIVRGGINYSLPIGK